MGNAQSNGRAVLLAVSAFMLAVPVYFLFVIAPGSGMAVEGAARLVVTVALLYFLLKGKNWARLALAFFALTGSVYLNIRLAFFHDGLQGREMVELIIKDAGYTVSGLLLVFSRSLREFLSSKKKSSAYKE